MVGNTTTVAEACYTIGNTTTVAGTCHTAIYTLVVAVKVNVDGIDGTSATVAVTCRTV